MPGAAVYKFGGFRFEPFNLRLTHGNRVIPLTAKSNDTLLLLVQQPDVVITKEALMAALWPQVFVDENNLNRQISTLRKALAQDGSPELIETVPRRGYRFIGPVHVTDASAPIPTGSGEPASVANVAVRAPLDRIIRPPAPGEGQRSPARARAAIAILVLLAAGVVIGWQWWQRHHIGRESQAAQKRGEELMRRGDARGAAAELQQAIRADPRNARAYGALAHALNKYSLHASVPLRGRPSPSVEAARRGAELDPTCGECQGTLGFFLFYHDWEWTAAEVLLKEAIRLEPDKESIRPAYAMLLSALGRQVEALQQIDFAIRRRPYQTTWLVIRASILYLDRRYAEAIIESDRALAIDDKERGAWDWRSKALFQLGRGEEAIKALTQTMFKDRTADLERAVRDGGTDEALRTLVHLTGDWSQRFEYAWRRAPWRVLLNDAEGGLEELERAYEKRSFNMIYAGVDPVYDRIRAHPRFQKVLTGMGLDDVLGDNVMPAGSGGR